MLRIRIYRTDDYIPHPCTCDCFGTGWSATGGGARLQGDVERVRVLHRLTVRFQTLDFCVRSSRSTVISSRSNFSLDDQYGTDRRIRAGKTEPLFCLVDRSAHEPFVRGARSHTQYMLAKVIQNKL